MKRIPKSWINTRVAVTWLDPTGYTNDDFQNVDVSECVSEGTLAAVDNRKIILRTARYKDSNFGDFTAITTGCIIACTRLK